MSKEIYKVIEVDNNTLNNERAENALFLNFCNPLVSLSFVKDKIQKSELESLCNMSKISTEQLVELTDDKNLFRTIICEDLVNSLEKSIDKDSDNLYFLFNIVKEQLHSFSKKEEEIMSIDVLAAKLYGETEEKGVVK